MNGLTTPKLRPRRGYAVDMSLPHEWRLEDGGEDEDGGDELNSSGRGAGPSSSMGMAGSAGSGEPSVHQTLQSLEDLEKLTARRGAAVKSLIGGAGASGKGPVDIDDDEDDEVIGWTEDADHVVLVEGDDDAAGEAARKAGQARKEAGVIIFGGRSQRFPSEISPTFQCPHCTLINERSSVSVSQALHAQNSRVLVLRVLHAQFDGKEPSQ